MICLSLLCPEERFFALVPLPASNKGKVSAGRKKGHVGQDMTNRRKISSESDTNLVRPPNFRLVSTGMIHVGIITSGVF